MQLTTSLFEIDIASHGIYLRFGRWDWHRPSPVVSRKLVLSALVMVGPAVASWSAFAVEKGAAYYVSHYGVWVILGIVGVLAAAGAIAYAGRALVHIINAAAWVVRRLKR